MLFTPASIATYGDFGLWLPVRGAYSPLLHMPYRIGFLYMKMTLLFSSCPQPDRDNCGHHLFILVKHLFSKPMCRRAMCFLSRARNWIFLLWKKSSHVRCSISLVTCRYLGILLSLRKSTRAQLQPLIDKIACLLPRLLGALPLLEWIQLLWALVLLWPFLLLWSLQALRLATLICLNWMRSVSIALIYTLFSHLFIHNIWLLNPPCLGLRLSVCLLLQQVGAGPF